MEVTLIIPAHNEEGRLGATLSHYGGMLHNRFGAEFEILVVANGCSDKTVDVAFTAAETLPQIRVVDIQERIGKGGAVLEGFQQARGKKVAFADADGSTNDQSLYELLEQLDNFDVVIGSRRLNRSVIVQQQPLMRQACGWAFISLVRLLFKMPYHDTQCGAKAFRRGAAYRLAGIATERRWAFDVDLLLSAGALGLQVAEHPVIWGDSARSHIRIVPTIGEIVPSLWRLRRRWARYDANACAMP